MAVYRRLFSVSVSVSSVYLCCVFLLLSTPSMLTLLTSSRCFDSSSPFSTVTESLVVLVLAVLSFRLHLHAPMANGIEYLHEFIAHLVTIFFLHFLCFAVLISNLFP